MPGEVTPFARLLGALGVGDTFSPEQYVRVLDDMAAAAEGRPLGAEQQEQAVSVLQACLFWPLHPSLAAPWFLEKQRYAVLCEVQDMVCTHLCAPAEHPICVFLWMPARHETGSPSLLDTRHSPSLPDTRTSSSGQGW